LNFTWEGIEATSKALTRLREGYQNHLNGTDEVNSDVINNFEEKFHEAINDDLNMPLAMSTVWETVRYPKKSKKIAELLLKFDSVLGIKIDEEQKKEIIPQEVLDLAEKRKIARNEKNWQESDNLRDQINKLGYNIKDTKDGAEITKI
jgi:cysteinyl-tRNA synthetase